MAALGWFLIGMGVLFVLLGFAGAVRDVLLKPERRAIPGEAWADLVRLLLEALRVLLTGPRWLLATAVGLALIWAGSRFVQGLPLF
ncbi:MAG: hypothetical protein K6T35_09085 [Meiothermus silvanus]|nr:hypothetical protein [Allomeiothermus silvanus]